MLQAETPSSETQFYFQQASTLPSSDIAAGFKFTPSSSYSVTSVSNNVDGDSVAISNPAGKFFKILIDFALGDFSVDMADTLAGNWTSITNNTYPDLGHGEWYFTYEDASGSSANKWKLINPGNCVSYRNYAPNLILSDD